MVRLALFTTLFSLVFGAAAAFAHPAVFSDLSFADAKTLAKKENKLLVVDFMASWCGPCHAMDDGTWPNVQVRDWVKQNAIALQVDVDKERTLSQTYRVDAMPTLIVFSPKSDMSEVERQVGFQDPSELLGWLNEIKTGKTIVDSLKEEVANAQAKGDDNAEAKVRFELAKAATDKKQYAVATEQYLWLSDRCLAGKPVHPNLMEMAYGMHILALNDPAALEQFVSVRKQFEGKNRVDWCVLCTVLDDNDAILNWFEEAKRDPSQKEDVKACANVIAYILKKEKRWQEIAYLYPNPIADIQKAMEESKTDSEKYMLFRKIPFLYAAYLAIRKDDIANSIADFGLKVSDTKEMRQSLLYDASAAHQYRPIQLLWYFQTLKWNELITIIIVGISTAALVIGTIVSLVKEHFLQKNLPKG